MIRERFSAVLTEKKFLTRQVAPSSGHQWESSTKETGLVLQVVADADLALCGVHGLCSTCWNSAGGLHPPCAQQSHKFNSV